MLTIVNTNFTGDAARIVYSDTIMRNGSLAGSYVTPLMSYKQEVHLPYMAMVNPLQADSTSYTDGGTLNYSERKIETAPLKVNQTMPWATIDATYLSKVTKEGALRGQMEGDASGIILEIVVDSVAKQLDRLIWAGDTASLSPELTHFDGFFKIAQGDAATVKATPTAVTTPATANALINEMFSKLPAELLMADDVKIFVSPFVFGQYAQFLGQGAGTGNWNNQGVRTKLYIQNIEVVPTYGFLSLTTPNSSALAARSSNLFFGTDLVGDVSDVNLLDQRLVTGDSAVRVVARMRAGVNYAVSSEVVVTL